MRRERIILACGSRTVVCDALVFGDWAAHRSPHLRGLPSWRVTHVPSGCDIANVADGLSRRIAVKVARSLGERMPRLPYRKLQLAQPPVLRRPLNYIAHAIIAEAMHPVRLRGGSNG